MPQQCAADSLPCAVLGPAVEPAPAGLVRRILLGHVPPAGARTENPEDALDDRPEVLRRAASAVFSARRGDDRREQRPLCVREPHADGEASLWPLSTAAETSIQVRPWIQGQFLRPLLVDLEDWVMFDNGLITSAPDAVPQDPDIVEHIGEAAALCVVSQIHALHEADWDHIPEHPGRKGFATFDFRHVVPRASDGELLVQVEAKGSSVEDNTTLAPGVRVQKAKIDEKKATIRDREANGRYPYCADLRYGIISALGRRQGLRCLLVDPPSEGGQDPRRYRLLARLRSIYEWVLFLSPRSQFASSFASRLAALFSARDPFEFTGLPLVRGTGEPFEVGRPAASRSEMGMFLNLCRIMDGSGVGTLLRLSATRLMFIGIRPEVYEMAATQNFETVMSYRGVGQSNVRQIECVLPRGRAREMGLLDVLDRKEHKEDYVHFRASGLIHYSEGSVVFGTVKPERYKPVG